MTNLLDHISKTSLLGGADYWRKPATREEWIVLNRDLVASTIHEMDEYLENAKLSLVEEGFISEGVL